MRTRVVILAAGKGKRMNAEIPKVLVPVDGKPILVRLYESVLESGVDNDPVFVVSEHADLIRETIGVDRTYVVQSEQLGTGHAVKQARSVLQGTSDAVIVLYGDHPFIQPETIRNLRNLHIAEKPTLTMLTVLVDDFEDWRAPLADFGRVIRDEQGNINRVVEKKDATEEELAVRELNPSLFCFDANWLWTTIDKIGNNNAQHEYYLPDLVRIAIDGGARIASVNLNPLEAIGVNMPKHLELANDLAKRPLD